MEVRQRNPRASQIQFKRARKICGRTQKFLLIHLADSAEEVEISILRVECNSPSEIFMSNFPILFKRFRQPRLYDKSPRPLCLASTTDYLSDSRENLPLHPGGCRLY